MNRTHKRTFSRATIGPPYTAQPRHSVSDVTSSDFPCNLHGEPGVPLGIDLGHVGLGVAQTHLGGLQAELTALPPSPWNGVAGSACQCGRSIGSTPMSAASSVPPFVGLHDRPGDGLSVAVFGVSRSPASVLAWPSGGSAVIGCTLRLAATARCSSWRFCSDSQLGKSNWLGRPVASTASRHCLGLGTDVDDSLAAMIGGLMI